MPVDAALVEFARELATEAGKVIMPMFRGEFQMELKADQSPVTEADRGAERKIRELIEARYPEHAILGEEFGADDSEASHRWIVDPIDGTVSFVNGVPLFATLIALEVDGVIEVGVANFPALGEMVWAARGRGCFCGDAAARVRECTDLGRAVVCSSGMHATDIVEPNGPEEGKPYARLGEVIRRAANYRGWCDAYGHVLVATGRADVMVDPIMAPWDIAALVPIIEESGGTVTAQNGSAEDLINAGSLVSSAGAIHKEVLDTLNGAAS